MNGNHIVVSLYQSTQREISHIAMGAKGKQLQEKKQKKIIPQRQLPVLY